MKPKIVASIHDEQRRIADQIVLCMPYMDPTMAFVDKKGNVVLCDTFGKTAEHVTQNQIIGTYTSNATALLGCIMMDLTDYLADSRSFIPARPAPMPEPVAREKTPPVPCQGRRSLPLGTLSNIVEAHLAIMQRIHGAQHGGGTVVWSDEESNVYAAHTFSKSAGNAERDMPQRVIGVFSGSVKPARVLELLYEHQKKEQAKC